MSKAVCPHCKGRNFYVHEFITYEAQTDDDNGDVITCYAVEGNGVDLIECRNEDCQGSEKGYLTDITDIQNSAKLNFNNG